MKDAATLWVLDDAQIQTHATLSCQSFTEGVGCCVGVLSTYSTCAFAYSTCPSVQLWVCVSCLCLSFYTASLVKRANLPFILSARETKHGVAHTGIRVHNQPSVLAISFQHTNRAVMDRIVTEGKMVRWEIKGKLGVKRNGRNWN